MSTDEKTCVGCGESWPNTTEFYRKTPTAKKHLQGRCIACVSDYNQGPAPRQWKTPSTSAHCLPAATLQGIFRNLVAGAHA